MAIKHTQLFTKLIVYGRRLPKNFPKHFVVTGAVHSIFLIIPIYFMMSSGFFSCESIFYLEFLRHNLQTRL